ncbi:MAG TPA: succinate dehydrogenase [Nitrososphaerales archaeon]|nr:succinate dehydrogenase [Nitrososphaerales archaeon]
MSSGTSEKARNKRGLSGWLNPYHYNFERWAYAFQRITGVAILAYVIGHLGDTSFFVGGPTGTGPSSSSWTFISGIVENSFGHLILVLVVLVVVFHGTNGIRLIASEMGLILGRPAPIEYPYKAKSLHSVQRAVIWAAIALAVVGAAWAILILFGGSI